MDDVFLVMYDYEGFKKKKQLEGSQPAKQPALTPSAGSMRFESDEDEEVGDDFESLYKVKFQKAEYLF